ncbi:Acyl-coenzyme A thioesterase [Hyphodiscus hymeniophilus]|uniref:Acyl-coenzyme A thioesterase n=1 Tax=Hyphodiscus hymeniophilus TaxID=353542 RepID=A0A9P6VKU8_9HELO|nr:Acyl-coenzyme A thioesterase [Hyphodiscus hymeniophilus]
MASKQFIYQEAPPETKNHFQSIPWALKLFSDPTLQPFTSESRIVKTAHTGDTFTARTLATEDTIPVWQSFHKLPPPGTESRSETITIAKLGSGVNGHIDICHGGFLSVLLDEVIGTAADNLRPRDKSMMTAYLKVDYKAPVMTPSTVLCRAWVESSAGRKMYGKGTVEDGEGKVMAFGDALFITTDKITARSKL